MAFHRASPGCGCAVGALLPVLPAVVLCGCFRLGLGTRQEPADADAGEDARSDADAAVDADGAADADVDAGDCLGDGTACTFGAFTGVCIARHCVPSVCGDGFIDPYGQESCDDGNRVAGEGCSDLCRVETGYRCDLPGEPCTPLPTDFLVSHTTLTQTASYSYVDLAVDWTRRLAYAGSREGGVCVSVIDFQDEMAPVLLGNLGLPTTSGETCLGVALVNDGRYLLLTSEAADVMELWDLGDDPRTLSYDRLLVESSAGPRRFNAQYSSVGGVETITVTIARRPDTGQPGGFDRLELLSDGAGWRTNDSVRYTNDCSHNFVVETSGLLIGGCWEDGMPIVSIPIVTAPPMDFDMNPGSGGGMWCGAASPDGLRILAGGWVTGFLLADPAVEPFPRLDARYDTRESGYRAATGGDAGGSLAARFYAVRSDPALDVWDWSVDELPRLVSHTPFEMIEPEFYGIAVNEFERRAVIVSNHGVFVVVDLARLWPATGQPPTF